MSLFFTFSQYRITKLTLIIVIFLRMNIISIKAIESETFDLLFFVGLFCVYAHVRVCVWGPTHVGTRAHTCQVFNGRGIYIAFTYYCVMFLYRYMYLKII